MNSTHKKISILKNKRKFPILLLNYLNFSNQSLIRIPAFANKPFVFPKSILVKLV
jgi:hypothetical protein